MNIVLFMTLQWKFLMNWLKRYTQSVHSVQWNLLIVIWPVSSISVDPGHKLLMKIRTIHGCDTVMEQSQNGLLVGETLKGVLKGVSIGLTRTKLTYNK